jgi:hypothetical protein
MFDSPKGETEEQRLIDFCKVWEDTLEESAVPLSDSVGDLEVAREYMEEKFGTDQQATLLPLHCSVTSGAPLFFTSCGSSWLLSSRGSLVSLLCLFFRNPPLSALSSFTVRHLPEHL